MRQVRNGYKHLQQLTQQLEAAEAEVLLSVNRSTECRKYLTAAERGEQCIRDELRAVSMVEWKVYVSETLTGSVQGYDVDYLVEALGRKLEDAEVMELVVVVVVVLTVVDVYVSVAGEYGVAFAGM